MVEYRLTTTSLCTLLVSVPGAARGPGNGRLEAKQWVAGCVKEHYFPEFCWCLSGWGREWRKDCLNEPLANLGRLPVSRGKAEKWTRPSYWHRFPPIIGLEVIQSLPSWLFLLQITEVHKNLVFNLACVGGKQALSLAVQIGWSLWALSSVTSSDLSLHPGYAQLLFLTWTAICPVALDKSRHLSAGWWRYGRQESVPLHPAEPDERWRIWMQKDGAIMNACEFCKSGRQALNSKGSYK